MAGMVIRFGHSHDADDAFLFHALSAAKVDTGDLQIEPVVVDFQTLNDRASRGELEATALSVHAYAYAREHYRLIRSGWTFSEGHGPSIVAREPISPADLADATVAAGGVTSSAYLAMMLWNPSLKTRMLPFDKVLPAVETGLADAGLTVHEDDMALELTGLVHVHDLGEWWAGETDGLPMPLGCVAVRKDVDEALQQQLQRAVQASVNWAMGHHREALDAAKGAVDRLEADQTDDFLGRYITDLSVDIAGRGQAGIEAFLRRGADANIIPNCLPLDLVPQAN